MCYDVLSDFSRRGVSLNGGKRKKAGNILNSTSNMCVIIIKTKGQPWPSKTLLRKAMDANPDGFAIAWNEDEKVRNYKSLTKEDILNYYEVLRKLDPKFTAMIFHARKVSVGDKNKDNCHCWIRHNIGFAHNGTMTNIPTKKGVSDSKTFFEDYFSPAYRAYGMVYALKLTRAISSPSQSRMAFINGNGDIHLIGAFRDVKDRKSSYFVSNITPFVEQRKLPGFENPMIDAITGLPLAQTRPQLTPQWRKGTPSHAAPVPHVESPAGHNAGRQMNLDEFVKRQQELFSNEIGDMLPF